ncbi:MAG: RecX family transcriptional regulator, partial [Saprospiraceae bacterium]|nr:RecX family transcriptional regulator [Saprospiraceae bacterium]
MQKPKKYISATDALKKLQRYCAYQDRCHAEVRSKLLDLGVYGDTLEEIMAELITDNFLNEERFARSYARGKFNIKKWGRIRIKQELKKRKITDYCIRKGMEEIEEEDYEKTLHQLIEKKASQMEDAFSFQNKAKIATYLIRRGFES